MKLIKVSFTVKTKGDNSKVILEQISTFEVSDDWRNSPIEQLGIMEFKDQLIQEQIKVDMKVLEETNLKS